MKGLFLTGATGRLGTVFLRRHRASWSVHPCSLSGGVDLRTAAPCKVCPEEADFCLNCAALSSRSGCAADPWSAFMINCRWPALLADHCREAGKRLVHMSTDLVYAGGIPPYTENSPAVPRSLYGWTKLLGDMAVMSRFSEALVVRTSVLVGKAGAGTPTFTEDILEGRARVFHSDAFRNHTPIEALTDYLNSALSSGESGLVLAAAPYPSSRAAYAFSILRGKITMAPAPEKLARDLTLRPSVRLELPS